MSQRPSGYARQPDDAHETPAWATQAVAPYLRERCRNVWEPANGPGSRMASVLRDEGFSVVATDDDFLARTALPHAGVDGIITNPPYGVGGRLAVRFIEHALDLAPVVAMLLRVDFDSGKTRTHLFRDCPAFAQKVALLDRIVWFAGDSGPSDNHAWYFWDRHHRGSATMAYAHRNDNPDQQQVAPQPRGVISEILRGYIDAQQRFRQSPECRKNPANAMNVPFTRSGRPREQKISAPEQKAR